MEAEKEWGASATKSGGRRVGGPKFRVFSLSHRQFRSLFPLLAGLLVELWPRVAAMDHPNCASGLFWGILCEPQRQEQTTKADRRSVRSSSSGSPRRSTKLGLVDRKRKAEGDGCEDEDARGRDDDDDRGPS